MAASRLARILDWIRAGYPEGVPERDYVPLFALLRRQVSEDEAAQIAARLAERTPEGEPVSRIDAVVHITKVIDELPTEADIARVRAHLERGGWPFEDRPLDPP
ncbi:DUF3349 domain-containing protein [Calidifontibacter sp. DB0510]|uniref:DUF3349 domain-containing protein n=1 Tax=Metallococcus carri TaxID=1656884 RepID=A0A967B7B5_9MICO|nr:DUF3349 domain-containing protein [Metallococcus carri]NHN56066.1 DUF3349 domain-containing protein [Metallococcus carri]NOP37477.1 DUF3349 domain-containing protein [Calidifontibacter sp. DB2511S]